MNDFKPFPASTKIQRQQSLEHVTLLHTRARKLLLSVLADVTIDPGSDFKRWLSLYVEQLEEEIHRLKSVKFTNKGVVEL